MLATFVILSVDLLVFCFVNILTILVILPMQADFTNTIGIPSRPPGSASEVETQDIRGNILWIETISHSFDNYEVGSIYFFLPSLRLFSKVLIII